MKKITNVGQPTWSYLYKVGQTKFRVYHSILQVGGQLLFSFQIQSNSMKQDKLSLKLYHCCMTTVRGSSSFPDSFIERKKSGRCPRKKLKGINRGILNCHRFWWTHSDIDLLLLIQYQADNIMASAIKPTLVSSAEGCVSISSGHSASKQ